jgi:RND family efflux transporter MFP subunit
MQITTIFMKIKAFFTKKRIIWTVVALVVLFLGWLIFSPKSNTGNIQTGVVEDRDIEKTVLATGQVVSATDLNLSFQSSGMVKKVYVKEGDKVFAGQLLAEQDTSDLLAQLHSAEAGLVIAKQQASSSKNNVANVTAQQNILVDNAYRSLLSSTPEAVPANGTSDYVAPTISGNYSLVKEGTIQINFYQSANGTSYNVSGLTTGSGYCNTVTAQPLGDSGLYIKCSSSVTNIANWKIEIPNKNASNYLTNYNAYQLALETRNKAIADAEASVGATDTSSVADAQVAQAQATVDSIVVRINNAKIVAPLSGTITQVDIKVGESAQATAEALKLLNVDNLHTEALVSEADIALVAVGQPIDNTFDALGPDKHFTTTVLFINPASTVVSGVVNYKVTGSLEKILEVKPGMTANMTIKVAEKKNVLVVPTSAIINRNGKQIVRVITDPKKKTYNEVEVQTGLEADGGLVEILSGLKVGEEIVTYMK